MAGLAAEGAPIMPCNHLSRVAIFSLTTALAMNLLPLQASAEEEPIQLGEITIFATYWEELVRKATATATVLPAEVLAQPASPDLDAVAARSARSALWCAACRPPTMRCPIRLDIW
jgi:hypothetical protein